MDKYSELYAFLYRSAKELISEFENMLLIVRDEKFPAEMAKWKNLWESCNVWRIMPRMRSKT